MSRSHMSTGGLHLSTQDEIALIFGLPVLMAMGVFSPAVLGQQVASWMIEHRILVPDTEAVVPLLGGTGLGWPQLSIVVGLLIVLIAVLGWRRRRSSAGPAASIGPAS
jgi:hypothetical protein